jgi:L-lactate dehydrogenase complex protein LldG
MSPLTTEEKTTDGLCARFTEKARAVSAEVHPCHTLKEAFAYTVDLCARQGACRIAVSGCEEQLSGSADALCHMKQAKIVAAPSLNQEQLSQLEKLCLENDLSCISSGLRSHLGGIDIGFTIADLAIAETGTIVINCPGEDLRLATMVCEYHVCVVRKSTLCKDAFSAEPQLLKYMHKTPNYTAFITGASRTADIERVLALGVHGPLELHILLLED